MTSSWMHALWYILIYHSLKKRESQYHRIIDIFSVKYTCFVLDFLFLFHSNYIHAIPLSFFLPRSFSSHAHVWAQARLLNWTACDLSSHITNQASRTHSITILLPLLLLPPPPPLPLPLLLLPSSPRSPPHRLYFISCRPRIDVYTRMVAYTPPNRSNEPERRARTFTDSRYFTYTLGIRYFTDSDWLARTPTRACCTRRSLTETHTSLVHV